MMICNRCQNRIEQGWQVCPHCQAPLQNQPPHPAVEQQPVSELPTDQPATDQWPVGGYPPGKPLPGQVPTGQPPAGQNPYSAPMPIPGQPHGTYGYPAQNEGDATGGIIPYKNPKALVSYYLGILSGLPLIGLPVGVTAFVLGIMGMRDRKRNPAIKGGFHAGVGIGCGGFFTLLWGLLIVGLIISLLSQQ